MIHIIVLAVVFSPFVQAQQPTCAKQKWINGRVPYITRNFNPNEEETTALRQAIDKIQSKSCVRFVPRNWERDFLTITRDDSNGCAGVGPCDVMTISRNCRDRPVFEHELLHVLGRSHEQDRADRDKYIRWDRHKPGCHSDSDSQGPPANNDPEALDIFYDYVSHVADWGECIRAKLPGNIEVGSGRRRTIAVLDFDKMNAVFNCQGCFAHRWRKISDDRWRQNPFIAGHELGGTPFHICRVYHEGHILVGKSLPNERKCYVEQSGREYLYESDFEVFTFPSNQREQMRWERGRKGQRLSDQAVLGGRTAIERETLYIGRCSLRNSGSDTVIPGYINENNIMLNVPFGGGSRDCGDEFEYLVCG